MRYHFKADVKFEAKNIDNALTLLANHLLKMACGIESNYWKSLFDGEIEMRMVDESTNKA